MIYDGVLPDPALTSHTLQYQHQHRRRHQQQKFGMYDLGKHPLGAAASSYYKAVMVLALALDLALALHHDGGDATKAVSETPLSKE